MDEPQYLNSLPVTSIDLELVDIPEPLANVSDPPLLTGVKLATAYNIPASDGANVKVGIISLGGGFSQADVNKSMSDLGLVAPTINFVSVDGATNNYTGNVSTADGENALDIFCIASLVPSANIVMYISPNPSISFWNNAAYAQAQNQNNSFANCLQAAVNDGCDVISISWGTTEVQVVGGVTYYTGDFMAAPFAAAAAANITVCVSAGDYGSVAVSTLTYPTVDYPSSNANAVPVGGTYLQLNTGNTRSSETVYNNSVLGGGFGGGGGKSVMVGLPSYQSGLNISTTTAGNVTTAALNGRGVPDISAGMNAYGVWLNNNLYGFSGTSASAPIMAGMFARFISLRKQRLAGSTVHQRLYNASANQSGVGASAYFDITTGNNASKITTGSVATVGWDGAVGLGVPNGQLLYNALYNSNVAAQFAAFF